MYTVLAIIIVIASIFLTIIVLVQNDKGGGLAANFASGNQTFGVRQTADFLEKAILADMKFKNVSSKGFCYEATLQQPESYISSLINLYISFQGKLTMKVVSSD